VRDERPFAGAWPPAALFCYSPDRKGEHPRVHLNDFCGVIHADGYAGFNKLFAGGRIVEVRLAAGRVPQRSEYTVERFGRYVHPYVIKSTRALVHSVRRHYRPLSG
jgi:hypothetical protein